MFIKHKLNESAYQLWNFLKKRRFGQLFIIVSVLPTKNITNADRNKSFFTKMPSLSMCEFLSTSFPLKIKNIQQHQVLESHWGGRWKWWWLVIISLSYLAMISHPHFYIDCPPSRWRQLLFSSLILFNLCLKIWSSNYRLPI